MSSRALRLWWWVPVLLALDALLVIVVAKGG